MRMEVRDGKNPDRLLGSLPYRRVEGKRLYLMVCPPLPRYSNFEGPISMIEVRADRIELDFAWRQTDETTKRLCYSTDAPLELLMRHDDFRLPRESDLAAYERLHRY